MSRTPREPNAPSRERGFRRAEKILAAAEALILEGGIEHLSAPKVAERAQVPNSSVYQFFPSPTAILNALSDKHSAALFEATRLATVHGHEHHKGESFTSYMERIVETMAAYYARHPVAAELFLKHSDLPRDAGISRLERRMEAARFGRYWHGRLDGAEVPETDPDPYLLMNGLIEGVLSAALREAGAITPDWVAEAKRSVGAFLKAALP